MQGILGILALLVSLGALACLIMVVIKLFQEKGAGHGVLGLICGLYTFIWGWQNASRLNIRNIMLIWSGLLVGSILLNMLSGASGLSQLPQTR